MQIVANPVIPVYTFATTLRRTLVDVAAKIAHHFKRLVLKLTTHLGSPSVHGPLDTSTGCPDIPLGLTQPPPVVESWVRCALYPAKKTKLSSKRPLARQNSMIEDSAVAFEGDINFQKLDSSAAFGHAEEEIAELGIDKSATNKHQKKKEGNLNLCASKPIELQQISSCQALNRL